MILRIYKQTPVRIPRVRLSQLAQSISLGEKIKKSAEVNLVFVSDEDQRKLNKQYRKKDSTTDVISFPLESETDNIIGEVYISVGQATRQAKSMSHSVSAEILRLFAHGFLHIVGYDHNTDAEEEQMRSRERKYLKKFGIAEL